MALFSVISEHTQNPLLHLRQILLLSIKLYLLPGKMGISISHWPQYQNAHISCEIHAGRNHKQ